MRFCFGRGLAHTVIETRNRDATIVIVQLRDDLREDINRIRNRAAIHAAVQVARRTVNRHFHVHKSTQSSGDRRRCDVPHTRVAHNAHIRSKPFLREQHEWLKATTSRFFLAFDHQRNGAGRTTCESLPRTERFDDAHDLTFVVNCSARNHALSARTIDNLRLKRRTVPQLEWISWLHIVVAVVENARSLGSIRTDTRMMRNDHRLTDRRRGFGSEAEFNELLDEPLRATTRFIIE